MKKVWILSALIMLLITLYQINSTYAKYVSEAAGTVTEDIGAWIVRVNNTNIATGTANQSFTINQLTYNSNSYVKQGKIAPGLLGYFDITIDATDSSVAVIYDVTLDFSQMNLTEAMQFTRLVRVVDGVESAAGITKTGTSTYTGVIPLSDIQADKTHSVRVYLEWEDDGTGTNDEDDSAIGTVKNVQVSIPVQVKVSQYQGETITAYEP